eukprot:765147-Hanusia_phi.AAC.4
MVGLAHISAMVRYSHRAQYKLLPRGCWPYGTARTPGTPTEFGRPMIGCQCFITSNQPPIRSDARSSAHWLDMPGRALNVTTSLTFCSCSERYSKEEAEEEGNAVAVPCSEEDVESGCG